MIARGPGDDPQEESWAFPHTLGETRDSIWGELFDLETLLARRLAPEGAPEAAVISMRSRDNELRQPREYLERLECA